ncbi:MAG TPA: hypothetical protein VGR98_21015 [Streptosporangiaceae bacterium]|nr:hypothetical protein [Streptosporangiaceae bacterium]
MSCQAKVSVPFLSGPLFFLCGEPSTAVYDYWCACGLHARRGETCEAHRPAEGKVGCVQCFTGRNSHDCEMSFAEAGGLAVCDLCGMPAVLTENGWMHGEAADTVFCALIFPRRRGVGSGGSE